MAPKKRPSSRLEDFDASLAAFLALLMLSEDEHREIADRSARQSATIGVYTQALVARQAWAAMDEAERNGIGFAEAQQRLREAVEREWLGKSAWRTSFMAGMTAQKAYQRGRWDGMLGGARLALDEAWTYTSALEARTCAFCRSLHGTTLPASSPWWTEHTPPMHPSCLCALLPAGKSADPTALPPSATPDPGFGRPEEEFDPSWGDFPVPIATAGRAKK